MEIYVLDSSPDGREFIGNSREELTENLYRTAGEGYTDKVLTWFDTDHSQPFKILNDEEWETWTVINNC